MARYPSRASGRRGARTRNRVYIISALLIVAVVIVLFYGRYPFGENEKQEPPVRLPEPNVAEANETILPAPLEVEPEPNLLEIPKATSDSNPEVAELIVEAMGLINATPSRIIDARDKLNEALSMAMSDQQQAFVKGQLSELANKWLFGRSVYPLDKLCGIYKIKPGDQLRIIGRQFKVPYEILMDINKISRPEALRADETIKVINGPFDARVYRSTFTMDLYLQNTFIRSFPVGLGKPGMETPTGLWLVEPGGKLVKPTWRDPISGKTFHPEDPNYPLGSRWIGLEGKEGQAKGRIGFALHGTKKPEQIGTADSQGCIRLHNGDVILMYKLLMPGFSRVEVVE